MIGPKCMVLYTDTCNYVIFANRLPLYPCKLLWTNQITELIALLIRLYTNYNRNLIYLFVIVVINNHNSVEHLSLSLYIY